MSEILDLDDIAALVGHTAHSRPAGGTMDWTAVGQREANVRRFNEFNRSVGRLEEGRMRYYGEVFA